jgi:hypothetical protein
METYFSYLLKATCCLSFFYLLSLVSFRNDTNFKMQRWYLLASIAIALVMPLNRFSISLAHHKQKEAIESGSTINMEPESAINTEESTTARIPASMPKAALPSRNPSSFSLFDAANITYWIMTLAILFRIVYSILYLIFRFNRSERERLEKYTIIYHLSLPRSYSFFRWIFISAEAKNNENKSILHHELVHAAQYHSFDVMAIELLTAVMWFNPLIWLMRRWMQQLHEYLADEGVVASGTNILEYQALLVNQVAGDRLICLPSGFNQSIIKKRLIMMTKTKIDKKKGYRLFALIPLAGCMFIILSFTNKREVLVDKKEKAAGITVYQQMKPERNAPEESFKEKMPIPATKRDTIKSKKSDAGAPPPPPPVTVFTAVALPAPNDPPPPPSVTFVTAVAPTRMNVFYMGVDNPVDIAVSGVPADKVFPEISNGTIRRIGNKFIVNPKQIGSSNIAVYADINGEMVIAGNMQFRVKKVPDPIPRVSGKKGGAISLNKLLEANELEVILENFDFDLKFTVTGFTVSATINGFAKDITTRSSMITDAQKDMIRSVHIGDKIYFNDIEAAGSDGSIRELPTLYFTIEE